MRKMSAMGIFRRCISGRRGGRWRPAVAALIATLLPDPGDAEKRSELCEKIAGKVVKRIERKKMPNGQIVERIKEETEGGILHWGRETENAETLQWFRDEIRKAYGGRAPKVLDPFAGGGAIPLEAMRLGCEATAIDINPVAWFILKCTLEYPQKLAGQTRPLPEFILHNDAFMGRAMKRTSGWSALSRSSVTSVPSRIVMLGDFSIWPTSNLRRRAMSCLKSARPAMCRVPPRARYSFRRV